MTQEDCTEFVANQGKVIYAKEDLTIKIFHLYESGLRIQHEINLKEVKDSSDLLKNVAYLHLTYPRKTELISAFLSAFDSACKDRLGASYEHHIFNDVPFDFADTGEVYILKAVGTNRIKIGFSTNLRKRINSLSTGSPYPLELMFSFHGGMKEEKQLHRRFAQYKVNLEWFELSDEIKAWVQAKRNYQSR